MYKKWLNDFFHLPIFAIRRKPVYYKYYDFVEKAYLWDEETINDWQWANIRSIVDYAYNHVPYYKKIYSNVGYKPGDLQKKEDFEKLPTICKKDIKENFEDFYSDEINSIKYRTEYTGGSTNNPMRFYLDDDIYWREDAIYNHYWSIFGFNLGDKCISLRGAKLIGDDGIFRSRYSRTWNYLVLDSSHISPKYIRDYDNAIKSFCSENIQAYPSSIYLLAKTYLNSSINPPCFKRIILASENVYPEQVDVVKKVFNPDVIINQYGHTERIVLALKNPYEDGLGFVPYYGYMELLNPSKDDVISKPNLVGEITGTGITRVMPFIRYRTNDFAAFSENQFKHAMIGWQRVQTIEGRLQEFVITKDKRLVSTCSIAGAHIPELSLLYDMQYEQKHPGELIVNAVTYPNRALSDYTLEQIKQKLERFFDNKMNCRVLLVNELKRTNRNKKMMLIQDLDIKEYINR